MIPVTKSDLRCAWLVLSFLMAALLKFPLYHSVWARSAGRPPSHLAHSAGACKLMFPADSVAANVGGILR